MRADPTPIRGIADIEAIERVPLEAQNDVWTVWDLLVRGAEIDPDKAALHYLPNGSPDEPPETLSYRQLLARVRQAANLFHSLGIGSTDPVAILLPIVPQNYVALLAASTAGIAFPINLMLEADQIAALLAATRARVVVAFGPTPGFEIADKIALVRNRVPSLEHVFFVPGPGGQGDGASDFDSACSRQPADRLAFDRIIDPGDVALYVHTGGTTGMPKIARLLHRGIAYKVWAYSIILAQEPRHSTFAGNPLFHIGGIVHGAMASLARGMTLVLLGPMGFRNKSVIRDYWRLIERYRITNLSGVPTIFSALASVPLGDADTSSLRGYAMTGSAGLPVQVSRYFEQAIGVRILSNYGMTENTATIAMPPRDGDPRFGSSGIHLPFTRIRIVVMGEDGRVERECRTDEIGEILISGPGLTPGYLDESLNGKLFVDGGWLRTGDLGRLDADSYLWVTGRVKDLIIRGGHNIDPRVIEDTLMRHDSVALVAAVGKPDGYAGELPVAFVQLKPGRTTDAEELKAFSRAHIPERAAAPVDVFVLEAMPLTGPGKIFKPALRKRATHHVYSSLAASIAGAAAKPEIDIAPDPVRGTIVTVTLSRTGTERDREIEQKLHSALDAFTGAYRIAWRA